MPLPLLRLGRPSPCLPHDGSFSGLLLSSLLVIAGIYLVIQAKTAQRGDISQTINLNALERREQLLPVLIGD